MNGRLNKVVMTGKIMKATVWACDLAQACPVNVREYLIINPLDISKIKDFISSIIFKLLSNQFS